MWPFNDMLPLTTAPHDQHELLIGSTINYNVIPLTICEWHKLMSFLHIDHYLLACRTPRNLLLIIFRRSLRDKGTNVLTITMHCNDDFYIWPSGWNERECEQFSWRSCNYCSIKWIFSSRMPSSKFKLRPTSRVKKENLKWFFFSNCELQYSEATLNWFEYYWFMIYTSRSPHACMTSEHAICENQSSKWYIRGSMIL